RETHQADAQEEQARRLRDPGALHEQDRASVIAGGFGGGLAVVRVHRNGIAGRGSGSSPNEACSRCATTQPIEGVQDAAVSTIWAAVLIRVRARVRVERVDV